MFFLKAKRKPRPGVYVPIEKDFLGYIGGIFGAWAHCAYCDVVYQNEMGFNVITDRVLRYPSQEDIEKHRIRYYPHPEKQTLCKDCACKLVNTAYEQVKHEPLPGDICAGFDPKLLMIKPEELDYTIDILHSEKEVPRMNLLLESEKGAIVRAPDREYREGSTQ